MKFSMVLFRVLIPLAIIVGGGATAFAMINSAGTAEQSPPNAEPLLVSVIDPAAEDAIAVIRGTGVVEPARRIVISPEVSGRITSLSEHLVLGGRIEKGERLFKLDARDYAIELKAQRANVRRAKLDLEVEEGRGRVAEREYDLLGKDAKKSKNQGRLVLRKPQYESAEVAVQSAQSGVDRAKLSLERTSIKAPFNATVVSESVEVGQLVQPGSQMATLIGTDSFWVRVSLPIDDLALIDIPGTASPAGDGNGNGSTARVIQRLGNRSAVAREGRVLRLVGELDPETRRAQVLVEVESPLDPPDGQLPLLPGAFVDVHIEGHDLPGTRRIPRAVVVDGDQVLVADTDDKLARRKLEIRWGDEEYVYVAGGLEAGDRIITDKVSPVIEGMPLRTRAAGDEEPEATNDTQAAPSEGEEG